MGVGIVRVTVSAKDVETPALVLDRRKLDTNIARMRTRMAALRVGLRPHVKRQNPSMWRAVCSRALQSESPYRRSRKRSISSHTESSTSSTRWNRSRKVQARHGPHPTRRKPDGSARQRIYRHGACRSAEHSGVQVPVLIELDVDGHRSGVPPSAPLLLDLARNEWLDAPVVTRGPHSCGRFLQLPQHRSDRRYG